MMRRLRRASIVVTAVLTLALTGCDPATMQNMWADYGNDNDSVTDWTGADSTFSVRLPDGRLLWLFSDTYLGYVEEGATRSSQPPMVNNSAVLQDSSGNLGATLTGPDGAGFVGPGYWVMDGVVEGDTLRVFTNQFGHVTSGIASFSLPDLTRTGPVQSIPSDHPDVHNIIHWGGSILEESGYTYIYGDAQPSCSLCYYFTTYLARVPAGQLTTATWEYWTGTEWSTVLDDAQPLADTSGANVRASGSVVAHEGHYVLVGMENKGDTDEIRAYTSPTPWGPFSGPTALYDTPEYGQPCGGSTMYTYRVNDHPSFPQADPATKLFSYNVHCLQAGVGGYDPAWNYADATLYRARFVALDLP